MHTIRNLAMKLLWKEVVKQATCAVAGVWPPLFWSASLLCVTGCHKLLLWQTTCDVLLTLPVGNLSTIGSYSNTTGLLLMLTVHLGLCLHFFLDRPLRALAFCCPGIKHTDNKCLPALWNGDMDTWERTGEMEVLSLYAMWQVKL